jgi:uncharacterized protein YjbJ (UPF0337 family)
MNKDQFKGMWKEIKGQLKQQWGKLTDDDIAQINGKREELVGRLQKHYGLAKEKAEKELSTWESKFRVTDEEGEDFDVENFEEESAHPFPKKDRF